MDTEATIFTNPNDAKNWLLRNPMTPLVNGNKEKQRWNPYKEKFELMNRDGTAFYIYEFDDRFPPYTLESESIPPHLERIVRLAALAHAYDIARVRRNGEVVGIFNKLMAQIEALTPADLAILEQVKEID